MSTLVTEKNSAALQKRAFRGLIISMGLAALTYFLALIANIAKPASFLKYITPFSYCSGADIVSDRSLNTGLVAVGMALGAAGILAAYLNYSRKDL